MNRTIADIRENLPFVGCDNATALELCNEVDRLQSDVNSLEQQLQERHKNLAADYRETLPLVREFCELPNLKDRVLALIADRDRLQSLLDAERSTCASLESRLCEATRAGTPYAADVDARATLEAENQQL